MLVLKKDVKVKELEKYGFKVLVTEDKLPCIHSSDFYCTMAYKDVGLYYRILIENDDCYRQVTIVSKGKKSLGMTFLNWQLNDIYELIKDNMLERVEE